MRSAGRLVPDTVARVGRHADGDRQRVSRIERCAYAVLLVVALSSCAQAPVYIPLGGGTSRSSAGTRWTDAVNTLTGDLARNMRSEGTVPLKVAVLDFTSPDGAHCKAGASIAEDLTTALFASRAFEVVERRQLALVLKEQDLSASELMDPSDVAKLGRLVGVGGIVLGTMSPAMSEYRINARVILVETASVASAATTSTERMSVEQYGGCGG